MAEVKWIKIVTDIFDDEKILLIESMPDADSIIVIWFKLLCLAGRQNNSGVFLMNGRIPYTDEMLATLLLPAGITSEASITYRDEAQLISNSTNADETYINVVLPEKMKLNLKYLTEFSLLKDLAIMLRTFLLLFRR